MSDHYAWAVDARQGRQGQSRERQAWSLGRSAPPAVGDIPPVPPGGVGGGGEAAAEEAARSGWRRPWTPGSGSQ